ncbi:putative protein SOSEKI [Helianthus annuus]|nr:putative protein SOSEKI [Helianthus annuus]
MAASSRTSEEFLIPRKSWSTRNHKTGNERLIINNASDQVPVWNEPSFKSIRKVPVLYYLSRNGHLEHPHLIDVPLSSPHGLYLRGKQFYVIDFTNSYRCLHDSVGVRSCTNEINLLDVQITRVIIITLKF